MQLDRFRAVLELAPDERVMRIDHGWLIVHPDRPPRIVWDDGRESLIVGRVV
jgi:hypothetical protein